MFTCNVYSYRDEEMFEVINDHSYVITAPHVVCGGDLRYVPDQDLNVQTNW